MAATRRFSLTPAVAEPLESAPFASSSGLTTPIGSSPSAPSARAARSTETSDPGRHPPHADRHASCPPSLRPTRSRTRRDEDGRRRWTRARCASGSNPPQATSIGAAASPKANRSPSRRVPTTPSGRWSVSTSRRKRSAARTTSRTLSRPKPGRTSRATATRVPTRSTCRVPRPLSGRAGRAGPVRSIRRGETRQRQPAPDVADGLITAGARLRRRQPRPIQHHRGPAVRQVDGRAAVRPTAERARKGKNASASRIPTPIGRPSTARSPNTSGETASPISIVSATSPPERTQSAPRFGR